MPENGDQAFADVGTSNADWTIKFVSRTLAESIREAKQSRPSEAESTDRYGSTISRRLFSSALCRDENQSRICKIAYKDGRTASIFYGCFGEVLSIQWNDGTRLDDFAELCVSQTDGTISFKDITKTTHRILPGGAEEQIWPDGSRSLIKYGAIHFVSNPDLFRTLDKNLPAYRTDLFPSEITYPNGGRRVFQWQHSDRSSLCEIKQPDGSVWKNDNGTWSCSGRKLEITELTLSDEGTLSYKDALGVRHLLKPNGLEELINKSGYRLSIERDTQGNVVAVVNADGSRTAAQRSEIPASINDASLREMALSHYNLTTINDVVSRLALLNTLSQADRAKLTGSAELINPAQIEGQLANGRLEESDNRFLLTDIAAKLEEIRTARGETLNRFGSTIESLARQRQDKWNDLGELMAEGDYDWWHPFDKTRIPFETQERNRRWAVTRTEGEIQSTVERMQKESAAVIRTNLAADVYQYSQLRLSGRTLDADLKAAGMLERFGTDSLKILAPDVYLELKINGWKRLKEAGITQTSELPEYESSDGRPNIRTALAALQQDSQKTSIVSDLITKQALRAIDSQPEITDLLRLSSTLRQGLTDLQTMYSIGCSGTKTDGFVDQARTLKAELQKSISQIQPSAVKELIKELNNALHDQQKPITNRLARTELEARLQHLQQILSLVDPASVEHKSLARMFDAVESNAFDSNTLVSWLKDDAPMLLATSAAFAAAFAATGGWGLLLGPLVAQGAGIATQDLLYGTQFGPGTRSNLATYLRSDAIIERDGQTGQLTERQAELWKDVAKPQLQEYLCSVAFIGLTELTLGCATVMKDTLLRKLGEQGSNNFIVNAARTLQENTNKLRQLEQMARQHPEAKSVIETLLRGVTQDMKFQGQQRLLEKAIQMAGAEEASPEDTLTHTALSFAVTVGLIMAHRGINFARQCRRLAKPNHFAVIASEQDFLSGIDELRKQGCIVDQLSEGLHKVKLVDGSEIILQRDQESTPQKLSAAEAQMDRYAQTGRLPESLIFGAVNKGHEPRPVVPATDRAGISYSDRFNEVINRFEAGFPPGEFAKLLQKRGSGDAITQKILAAQFSKYLNEISPGFDADAYLKFMEENAGTDIDLTTLLKSTGMGSCSVDAMTLKALADHYGLKATMVRGNVDGGSKVNHAWVEIEFSDDTKAIFDRGPQGKMERVSDPSKYRSVAQIENPAREITRGIKRENVERTQEFRDSIGTGLQQHQVDRLNAVFNHLKDAPPAGTPAAKAERQLLLSLTQNIDTVADSEAARCVADLVKHARSNHLNITPTLRSNWLNPSGDQHNCQACVTAHILNESLSQLEMVKYLNHWLGQSRTIGIVLRGNNIRLTAESCEDINNSFRETHASLDPELGKIVARSASATYIECLLRPAGLTLSPHFSTPGRYRGSSSELAVVMDDGHVWTRNTSGNFYDPQSDRSLPVDRPYKTDTRVWKIISAEEYVRKAMNESMSLLPVLAGDRWPELTFDQLHQHLVKAGWTEAAGSATQPRLKAFRATIPGGRPASIAIKELKPDAKLYLVKREGSDKWILETSEAQTPAVDTATIIIDTSNGNDTLVALLPGDQPFCNSTTSTESLAQHRIDTTKQTKCELGKRIPITRDQAQALGLTGARIAKPN